MKKFLGYLALLASLSYTVQAVPEDIIVPVILQHKDVHYDVEDPDADSDTESDDITIETIEKRRSYPLSQLKTFKTLDLLVEDIGEDRITETPLAIPLGQATFDDFDILLAMAHQAAQQGTVVLPSSAQKNAIQLVNLLALAKFLDPQQPKVVYPITLALLSYIGSLSNDFSIDHGNPRFTFLNKTLALQTLGDTDIIFFLLDNLGTLMMDQKYNPGEAVLRPALEAVFTTAYVKDMCKNSQALLIAKGITQRAAAQYSNPKLYNRILQYLNAMNISANTFPLAPNFVTKKVEYGPFPISIQDLIDTKLVPQVAMTTDRFNNKLVFDCYDQHLTSLDGLHNVPNIKSVQELVFYQNKLTSLQQIRNLPALTSLDVSNNSFTSLQPLSNLPALESINIRFNQLTWLSPQTFAELPALKEINAIGNPLSEEFLASEDRKTLRKTYKVKIKDYMQVGAVVMVVDEARTYPAVVATTTNGYLDPNTNQPVRPEGSYFDDETGWLIVPRWFKYVRDVRTNEFIVATPENGYLNPETDELIVPEVGGEFDAWGTLHVPRYTQVIEAATGQSTLATVQNGYIDPDTYELIIPEGGYVRNNGRELYVPVLRR